MAKDFDPIDEELHNRIEASGFRLRRRLPDRRAVYIERVDAPAAGLCLCFANEAHLRDWLAAQAAVRRGGIGLWHSPYIPQHGWTCVGIEDVGSGSTLICEMCRRGRHLRFVHRMEHPAWPFSGLRCGYTCARRMVLPP
jgi:hypothetical protein